MVAIKPCIFCAWLRLRTFYFSGDNKMIDLYDYVFNSEEDIPEKVVDETGAVLTPCHPETCEGNGMHSDHEI